jgi:hypothetical protein
VDDDAAAVRAEWRVEEEQWSRAALERWEHGRTLADVLRDARDRGDSVTLVFASVAWSGRVAAVGDGVARVDAGSGAPVDVRLGPDAPFVLRVRAGARDTPWARAPLTTFTARLRELDGTAVCIGTAAGVLEGSLRIGHDQVRVTAADGGVAYAPAGSVSWVRVVADD